MLTWEAALCRKSPAGFHFPSTTTGAGRHGEAPAFSGYYRATKAAGRVFIPGSVDAILLETPLEGSPAPARPRPHAAARSLCWSARGWPGAVPFQPHEIKPVPSQCTSHSWSLGVALEGLAGFCSRFCFQGLFAPASLGGHLRNDREGSALILPDPQCWHRRGCFSWGSLLEAGCLLLGQW